MLRPELSSRSAKTTSKHDDAYLVMIEELIEHQPQFVAAPRPASLNGEAFLIDVYDNDARIHVARHCQTKARVIDNVFEAIDKRDAVTAAGMAGKQENHDQPERYAHEVLLQAASFVVLDAGSTSWAEPRGRWIMGPPVRPLIFRV